MPTTQDGYSWHKHSSTVKKGNLECRGVIIPPEKRSAPAGHIYDVIVIGAGYSGLMAARDMVDCGEFSLLD